MKKRIILFSLGLILLLSALPLSTKMILEKIHTQKMYSRYDMEILSDTYPPPAQKFTVLNHSIEIDETIIEEGNYTDLWDNDIAIANLTIKINGERLAYLENYPIRSEDEGIQKYHGNISFIVLLDKQEEERTLFVVLRNTKDTLTNEKGVHIISSPPPLVDIKYTMHVIDEEGQIESDTFSQNNRNALQTFVLNSSGSSPTAVGYYTDAWHAYPSIFFPILFPFSTLFFGVILMIVYVPLRRKTKVLHRN